MDGIAMSTIQPQGMTAEYMRQCDLCQKPFLKESSYNRHVLYCRRTRHRPRARARVCQACSLAKVKCSLDPQCQRCLDKGIQCVYDTPAGSIAPSKRPQPVETLDTSIRHSNSQSSTSSLPVDEIIPQTSNELCPGGDSDVHMDWSLLDFDATHIMPSSPKNAFPCLPEPPPRPEDSSQYMAGIRDCRSGIFDHQSLVANNLSWPSQSVSQQGSSSALTRTNNIPPQVEGDHLLPIPKADPLSNHTAKVIMEMLRAFPQMMLRRETLPPFIHGHWYNTPGSTESSLPAPLLNCMGLAQVFASRAPETRSFLWRTIQSEQKAAMDKADQGNLPKRLFIASIQAQLIYIMMRITDTSAAETGFNFQLLVIWQRLCERFKELLNQPFFQQENHNPSQSWEDWIFAESRRRVAIVWLLITQMVHIKIGVPCDSFEEFREIPLPAPRALWEARSRAAWQSEFEMYHTTPRMGMETVGDLIKASGQCNVALNKLRLDIWNAGIDNLGLLLNLSLVAM